MDLEQLEKQRALLGLPSYVEQLKRQQAGQTPVTPLEVLGALTRPIESVTAAPARAAVAKLQQSAPLSEVVQAFKAQMGKPPETAPSGEQLAQATGLGGKPAKVAGLGLEMAIDPTNLIGAGVAKAAVPLLGLAGVVNKIKQGEKIAEAASVAAKPSSLGFYSKLEDEILKKMGGSATPEQVMAIAKGAKEEEVATSGLAELLKGKEKVTQEEVLQTIRQNRPHISESIKGPKGEPTRFAKWQEPGGENYREVLFTLPQPESDPTKLFKSSHWDEPNVLAHARVNDRVDEAGKKLFHVEEIQSDWHQAGRKKGYQSKELEALKKQKESMTLNLNERRIDWQLATTKLNAILEKIVGRGDALDKASNVLWRQGPTAPLIEQQNGIKTLGKDLYDRLFSNDELMSALKDAKESSNKFDRAIIQNEDLIKKIDAAGLSGVPDAPFKKNWMELMAKRMVTQAVESGADRLSWTPGAKQAARYDLSKQVDELLYKRNADGSFQLSAQIQNRGQMLGEAIPENKLSEYVGKDVAEKISNNAGKSINLAPNNEPKDTWQSLSGIDLQVGGEGMKGFYDKILPDFLRKFGKKYGAEVGETVIPTNPLYTKEDMANITPDKIQLMLEKNEAMKVPYLELTPKLKEAVLKEGVPLFAAGAIAMPAVVERMRQQAQEKAVGR